MVTRSAREAYRLHRSDLIAQMHLAVQGDNGAAIRVANHYGIAVLSRGPALRWLALAARRGDVESSLIMAIYQTAKGGAATGRR